jgi:hypothetical protein
MRKCGRAGQATIQPAVWRDFLLSQVCGEVFPAYFSQPRGSLSQDPAQPLRVFIENVSLHCKKPGPCSELNFSKQ